MYRMKHCLILLSTLAVILANVEALAEEFSFVLPELVGVQPAPSSVYSSLDFPFPPGQYDIRGARFAVNYTTTPGTITCCHVLDEPCQASEADPELDIWVVGTQECPLGWGLEPYLPELNLGLYLFVYQGLPTDPCAGEFPNAAAVPLGLWVFYGSPLLIIGCEWTEPGSIEIFDASISFIGTRSVATAGETWSAIKRRY